MIRLPTHAALDAETRFGLDVLVDLSRLVPVLDASADVVRLEVHERAERASVSAYVAAGWDIMPVDGRVIVSRAMLRALARLAGATEEQRSGDADRHFRIPSAANPLVAEALERQPVVNHAAMRLREAVVAAAGRRPVRLVSPWPDGHRWAAAITHDLDVVAHWPLFSGLRLAELVAKGEWTRSVRAAAAAAGAVIGDPVLDGVRRLLRVEQAADVRATWFVMAGTPTFASVRRGDLTYLPESPRARTILAEAEAHGHEIGLHGSFETLASTRDFRVQRDRLAALARGPVSGVRQHFLRMRPGHTQRAMHATGFAYDATYGFADRSGFRLGTADVVPVWDDREQAATGMDAVPLAWMDRTMSKYQGIEDPMAWIADGLSLAASCRAVEGLWTGLWHPNLVPALGYPGAGDAFAALVGQLRAGAPYMAPLAELVAWRRARRSVRVGGATGELGVTAYASAAAGDGRLWLEDAHGRRREAVHVEPATRSAPAVA